MVVAGVDVVAAAVLVVPALWLWPEPGLLAVIAQVSAALTTAALLVAVWFAVRPPVVMRLDADGYRSRIRFSTGRFAGRWADVEDAQVSGGHLVLANRGARQIFPLRLVGDRRVQLLREVNARLDAAHGYRRLG